MPWLRRCRGVDYQNLNIMYIIFDKECIDTSNFKEMRVYGTAGIITFVYQNPGNGKEVELAVIFDEDYEAETTFHGIIESYEMEKEVYISEFPAYIPPVLLNQMKKGLDVCTEPFSEFPFERNKDN